MADYIYLLQTRLTAAQQTALQHVIDAARLRGMTVFLVGGAVRDLTNGTSVRDLDVAVQGTAPKLKKDLQKAGGTLIGEDDLAHSLHFNFPGGVRLEVGSTLSVTFPKPGKPVYKPANILDDLRRRDFTANAMAVSLNDGSYGLLMDPLNGVADIENRELRLVSNYGFIEDPARMIRSQRLAARLGWRLEDKTEQRYQTGKTEHYISALSPAARGYELEEIFHEEDPLRVLRQLDHEGWAKVLYPTFTAAKANENELNKLRDLAGQLEMMGIHPDPSPAYFPLLTAKLPSKDVSAIKKLFARPGYVAQIAALESQTKAFSAQFLGKAAAAPSAAWKILYSAEPEPILWLAHTGKGAPVQNKFKAFFNEWSQARTKIPYQLMQEMRITPDLPVYNELLEKLFFAIMDSKLDTPEATRAFLEPYSPPAPPPPVNLRRRTVKREAKVPKSRAKKTIEAPAAVADAAPAATPAPSSKQVAKSAPPPVKVLVAKTPVKVAKAVPVKAPKKSVAKKPAVKAPAKKVPAKTKTSAKKAVKPVKKTAKKATAKKTAPKKKKPVQKAKAKTKSKGRR